MKVKTLMIEGAAKLVLDSELWTLVKRLVLNYVKDDKLTGPEKHDLVLTDLKCIFTHLGTSMLNLAISLAVVWAKQQAEK
jgi:hypothetical protein